MGEASINRETFITVQEYLDGEMLCEVKHDYRDGKVTAMAGASVRHEEVALALSTALYTHLAGKPCRAYKSDVKLKLSINSKDIFYYPDILVACDPKDRHQLYREHPKVLIEVLSEDEDRDLVDKFLAYRTLESLEEYIVLGQDPNNPVAYIHRRTDGWKQQILKTGDLEIPSLDFRVPLDQLYVGARALEEE